MQTVRLFLLYNFVGVMSAVAASADTASTQLDSCAYFFDALQAVPHDSLTHRHGLYESTFDGKPYQGCEVKFVTHDELRAGKTVPTFETFHDSELYRLGWRTAPSLGADGPGSGLFAIENDAMLCLIPWTQPAYLADSGDIVQSNTLDMTIQCRDK